MSDYNVGSDTLPSDDEILKAMEDALDDNLTATQSWRQVEVREIFAMFEGNQWTKEAADRQIANGMPCITINRMAPILESICGFEVQNRLDIKYSPRLMEPEQNGFNDVLNNAVQYIQQATHAQSQYSLAFKDMLLCGVGALNTSINYDNNPDGAVESRRVFPAFIFWDITARAKNIIDANSVIEIKVLDTETLVKEYDIETFDDVYSTSTIDARILEFFETILAVETLGVVYEYQWREKKPFYRVKNPFKDLDYSSYNPFQLQAIQALAMQAAEEFKFDPMLDGMFSIFKKQDLTDLKKMLQPLGIKVISTTQKKYCYYRAIITGGKVITKAENFSQEGFSIKFMTGQFSELTQSYYGLGRGCRDPQRMLNQTVSDYVGFLQSIPKGGVHIEADAVPNLDAFIDTYSKARNVTVFNPGALSNGKVLPKVAPPLPQGILEMIQYADDQIMKVCGVTPEFMGMMTSKEMNSSFYQQQIQQGLTPLATYLDAKYLFLEHQARLYIDCVRVLVENSEGRLIKNVIGDTNMPYIPLLKDGIAEEYDVIVEEMPSSPNQNRETFNNLLDLQKAVPDKNLMPLIIKFSPFAEDITEELEQQMSPPPQQPDPVNQQLLISQAQLNSANAEKQSADADNVKVDTQMKMRELHYADAKELSEVNLNTAKAEQARSSVKKSDHDIVKGKHDIIANHMSTMNNLMKGNNKNDNRE